MSVSAPDTAQHGRTPLTAALVLSLGGAVMALYGLSWAIRRLPCWGLVVAIAVVAYPLWLFLSQRALLSRRAILAQVAKDTSWIARWFWRGTATQVGLVFVALALAAVLVVVSARLRGIDWAILGADAVLVGLCFNWVRRSLARQIEEAHQGLLARMWPALWVNSALLIATFVAVDYYSGHVLLQGMWLEVVEGAFKRGQQDIACPAIGMLLGMANVIEQLSWKAAVGTLPHLPDMPTKVIGWLLFLAWTGFGVVVFTQFLLGVVAWVDGLTSTPAKNAPSRTVWRSFVATVLVLAVPYLYASWKLSTWEPESIDPESPTADTPTVPADPCADFRFNATELESKLTDEIQRARLETRRVADQRIDALLDSAFARAEKGADAYLDWYFSLYGDYSRLLAVMVGDLDEVMRTNLAKYLFEDTGFAQLVESQTSLIQEAVTEPMLRLARGLPEEVRAVVDVSECPIPSLDLGALVNLDADKIRAAVSTTSAVTVGMVTAKTLGKKAAAAAASKAAASGTVKMAAKIAGKAVARKGASAVAGGAAGAAVCAPAGPVAVLCGVVGGVITWIAVDKAVIEVEEYLNRDDMRADLLAALNQQRAEVRKELQTIYHGIADAYAFEIQARADQVFVPARDGL